MKEKKLLHNRIKFGTVMVTHQNFIDFLKNLCGEESPKGIVGNRQTLLPGSVNRNPSTKSITSTKELLKNALNIKNISIRESLTERNKKEVKSVIKSYLAAEVLISEIRNYIYNTQKVNIDIKKKNVLEDWDRLIGIFIDNNMKKYAMHAMKAKGDICFEFQYLEKALFEYRKAVRFFR